MNKYTNNPATSNERYERQILMPEIGNGGQKCLENAKVAVIGAGGLGSPVLYYLASAGVGNITIIDSDYIVLSNLNRQLIHWEKDIGREKVFSSLEKLQEFNSTLNVTAKYCRLTDLNAYDLLNEQNVLIDCVDNIQTRLLVNKWGNLLDIPIVEGGVEGYSGFIMNVKRDVACIGCLFGNMKDIPSKIPILGAVAGAIGSMQAIQCIKILTGQDQNIYSRIWQFDFLAMSLLPTEIERAIHCPICGIDIDFVK